MLYCSISFSDWSAEYPTGLQIQYILYNTLISSFWFVLEWSAAILTISQRMINLLSSLWLVDRWIIYFLFSIGAEDELLISSCWLVNKRILFVNFLLIGRTMLQSSLWLVGEILTFWVFVSVRLLDLSFNWKAAHEDEREVVFLGGDIHCGVTSGTIPSIQTERGREGVRLPRGWHPLRGHLRYFNSF